MIVTVVPAGIEEVIQTVPPITGPSPITALLPKIVAPEYIITLSFTVGCRFNPLINCPLSSFGNFRAPRVAP